MTPQIKYPFKDFFARDVKGNSDYFEGFATIERQAKTNKWEVTKVFGDGGWHGLPIAKHYEATMEHKLRADFIANEEIERRLKEKEMFA